MLFYFKRKAEESEELIECSTTPSEDWIAVDLPLTEKPNPLFYKVVVVSDTSTVTRKSTADLQWFRDRSLNYRLLEIDSMRKSHDDDLFTYQHEDFYVDRGNVIATKIRGHSTDIIWKTASKPDGVNNTMWVFSPTEFESFSNAMYDYLEDIWSYYDELKSEVKAIYQDETKEIEDIDSYPVVRKET